MREPYRRPGKRHRQQEIIAELRVHPSVRASDLARRLGVHVETIRRDLDELHEKGKISRTYGGALPAAVGFEASLAERGLLFIEERGRIADHAVGLVAAGDVLMIDVGSTTAHFAHRLAQRGEEAQIITNSCNLAAAIGAVTGIRTILCPGQYSFRQGGVAGAETIAFLQNFHADKAIFSVGGITENGLYEVDPDFAWVKRAMISHARTRIVLADSSKFGRAAMTQICGFEEIDVLVTDQEIQRPILDALRASNIDVRMVEKGEPS